MKYNRDVTIIKRCCRRIEFILEYVVTGRHQAALDGRKTKKYCCPLSGDKKWHKLRRAVLDKYPANCMRCNSKSNINIDHIKPKSKYPHLIYDFNNLQILCWGCNKLKGSKDETDYRPVLCH